MSFYDDLSTEMQSKRNCISMGDFNKRVQSLINEYERVREEQGWGIQNKDGERFLEFADRFDMVVGNTFIKKDSEKLITFKSSGKFL